MKKLTLTLFVTALAALGISSCKKDSTQVTSDIADKYVGIWNGYDTGRTQLGDDITFQDNSIIVKKISSNKILLLDLPRYGDSIFADVAENSMIVTSYKYNTVKSSNVDIKRISDTKLIYTYSDLLSTYNNRGTLIK